MELEKLIIDFLYLQKNENFENIYNEFSLQHELGIFLRKRLSNIYKVEFERNASFFLGKENSKKLIKKEIDIVIYDREKNKKIAVELKHPLNGQYPEQMFSFIKDIKFLEELIENGFTKCISLVLVKNKLFYEGDIKNGIYSYFRGNQIISNSIDKPTGKLKRTLTLTGKYKINWYSLTKEYKYYILELD